MKNEKIGAFYITDVIKKNADFQLAFLKIEKSPLLELIQKQLHIYDWKTERQNVFSVRPHEKSYFILEQGVTKDNQLGHVFSPRPLGQILRDIVPQHDLKYLTDENSEDDIFYKYKSGVYLIREHEEES